MLKCAKKRVIHLFGWYTLLWLYTHTCAWKIWRIIALMFLNQLCELPARYKGKRLNLFFLSTIISDIVLNIYIWIYIWHTQKKGTWIRRTTERERNLNFHFFFISILDHVHIMYTHTSSEWIIFYLLHQLYNGCFPLVMIYKRHIESIEHYISQSSGSKHTTKCIPFYAGCCSGNTSRRPYVNVKKVCRQ